LKGIAFGLMFVVLGSLLLPYAPVNEVPLHVPHEDPGSALGRLDGFSFLAHYVDILTLVSLSDYGNASKLMDEMRFVSVPDNLRYVADRYSGLIEELIDVLDNLEKHLDEASGLLGDYRLSEATEVLQKAGVLVVKAELLLGDLQEATSVLSSRLGVFAASAESKLVEVYGRLQAMLQRLRELIDRYHALMLSLRNEVQQIEKKMLKDTELSLGLSADSVFVGELIVASGRLVSDGVGLANRNVTVSLNGQKVAFALTNIDGFYSVSMKIPYWYVDTLAVKASYAPVGGDRDVYLGCVSRILTLDVLFYETRLDVTAPKEAYPGLSFIVSGKVFSLDGLPLNGRSVRVLLDDVLLSRTETDMEGFFLVHSTVGSWVSLGAYKLVVIVDAEGVYAGVSQERSLLVSQFATEVDVSVPSFLVLPAGVFVEGQVSSVRGPLAGALVTLELSSETIVVESSSEGWFNATLHVPLNLVLAGFQEVRVLVDPIEPWQALGEGRAGVFIVNPFNLGLIFAAFACMGAAFYMRMVRSSFKKSEGLIEVSEVLGVNSVLERPIEEVGLPSRSGAKFEGVKRRVVSAYVRALRGIESVSGVVLLPEMTLREFLLAVEPKLNDASKIFGDLTTLVEKVLYSAKVPELKDAAEAEALTIEVGRLLRSGIA
jgi:hypothetical protein